MNRAIRALVAHALLLCACLGSAHAQPSSSRHSDTEIIMKLRPGNRFLHAPPGTIKSSSPSLDARLNRVEAFEAVPVFTAEGADPSLWASLGMDRFYVVRLRKPADIPAIAAELSRHPDVELADPSYGGTGEGAVATQSVIPNDTYFGRQWAFRNTGSNAGGFPALAGADIKATDAWSISTGDSGVIVAVLDSGVKYDHPDIADRLWVNQGEIPSNTLDDDGNGFIDDVRGWNFAYQDGDVRDDLGHGTNVSSILGATANNGLGYAGLDWSCKIMTLKVLNSSNFGFFSWWAAALQYAADNGARVVNMSLVGADTSPVLEIAIRYAHARGCFIAASMGNAGAAVPEFIPAVYAEVVAVGSTNALDRRSSFSSYGGHIDVVAPGELIYGLSHLSDTDYDRAFFGTSMAAPMVAGLASLLLAKDPSLGPDEIRDIIRATADDGVGNPSEDTPGFDVYHGFGRINCYRALALDHVPHAPVITVPAEVSGPEGALISIDVSVTDPDGDPIRTLTAGLGALPPGHNAAFSTNADNTAGVLTWTPTVNDAGNYSVTFTASDVLPGSATTRIAIANLNQAPTITAPAALSVGEDVLLQFDVRATDPDLDDLTLDAAGVPSGARFFDNSDNTGTFLWLPALGQAGSYLVLFGVTDGHGGSTTASTQIEVTRADRPPTVTAPGEVVGDEGILLSFEVTAADPDGEAIASLLADLSGLPLGHEAAFVVHEEGARGTFSWTPGFGHAGGYPVIFTGSNAAAGSATTFLTIQDVDRRPAVTVLSPVAGTENALIAVAVTAADPDGDAIQSLTADPLPAGATFEVGVGNSSGILRWTPDFTQAGAYAVMIAARSAPRAQPVSAPLVEGSATIVLEIANVDRSPNVTAPPSAAATENTLLELTVAATDPDGEAIASLTADLSGLPLGHGAVFTTSPSNTSGTLAWTPDFTHAGAYTVTFVASNSASGSATTSLTVANVNRAPIADAGGPYSGVSASPVQFDGSDSSDPDGDALTYAWDFGDGSTGSGPTPAHMFTAGGTFNVTLRVTDTSGLYGDDAATATIRAVIPVVVILVRGDGTTLDARKAKAHTKFALEETELPYPGILANTLQLTTDFPSSGTVSSCPAELKAGTGEIGDVNLNGIPDYLVSFSGVCVKNLFSNVPNNSTVNVIILGQFATSTGTNPLRGVRAVTVRTGGDAAPISASAYPNPFNPETAILYTVKNAGPVTLRIYSFDGRLVRTLKQAETTAAGTHEMSWNGTDDHGRQVSSGIYFVKTTRKAGATEESSVFKLVVTR
jgi:thermitase